MTAVKSVVGTVAIALFAPFAQTPRLPGPPVMQRGACPFECCHLGDWKTTEPTRVYATERATGAPAFIIPQGQSIKADSADFFTLRYGVIVVRRPFALWSKIDPNGEPA